MSHRVVDSTPRPRLCMSHPVPFTNGILSLNPLTHLLFSLRGVKYSQIVRTPSLAVFPPAKKPSYQWAR